MKLFGLELAGVIQSIVVKCPMCGGLAHAMYVPEAGVYEVPIPRELKEALSEMKVEWITYYPSCTDLHIFHVRCKFRASLCEVMTKPCTLNIDETLQMYSEELDKGMK